MRKYAGLAIASPISAFIVPLVGAVLGFVARSQIRRSGQNGSGLALAGIIIGVGGTVLNLFAVIPAVLVSQGSL